MKLSIGASKMTHDSSLASLDFDVTRHEVPQTLRVAIMPPCRPPVFVIRRSAGKMVPPAAPSHTRSETGAIAPTAVKPSWWLVLRSATGSLRIDQECQTSETIEYQSKSVVQAERFLSGLATSAYKPGKEFTSAVNGRGRAVFCPIEGKV